ncbi:EKC/KEOPS complex subunit TP53RK [Toxorhynchites rutilus septentrionalis]|uniref:EKC/KEOPS complex subunit TP53RK n=1 Tax=Toxorhynchites rutilus septentrionalis TaxID=329112 RepID=UPI00247AC5C3|nr:EKC/KEOPS complex subunit TP53RK [Toxorhynchites rutilus septentrionalis]
MAAGDSEPVQHSDTPTQVLLKQGAEGKLFLGQHNGVRCLVKERFSKKYRHPDLDIQLTRQRIKAEQKAFERCKAAGVTTPKLLGVDLPGRKIYMEYLEQAITAKQFVDEAVLEGTANGAKIGKLAEEIGRVVGILHANNIIHGDLTTSNMLLDPVKPNDADLPYKLVMIDFGLSYHSLNVEDMGVDLYVLDRALLSAHSQIPELFGKVLESYKKHNKFKLSETIAKYEEVRTRGRKRTMIG